METETLLHQNPQHEPSVNTKRLWLYCRRKETQIGSPGLLCSPARWDLVLFFVILVLEFIGLYLFYKYVGNLVFAISFFAADITYAISAHLVYGKMSLVKNRIYLLHQHVKVWLVRRGQRILPPSPERQAKKERWILLWLRIYAAFFYLLIALLAVFKMGGFIANWPGRDPVNSISITICLTYVVVAALQIYATGYFTFTSLFNALFSLHLRQHRSRQGRLYARIDAGNPLRHEYEGIDLHTLLLTDPRFEELGYRQKNRKNLPKFNNCAVRNHFIHHNRLYLYGVLTDEDLNGFVTFHANQVEARHVLGLILLAMQLEKCLLQGGRDLYTEPIPFPAGNIAGVGAIDRTVYDHSTYSIARVGNDRFEHRKERAGLGWHYEWILEEFQADEQGQTQQEPVPVPGVLNRSEDQLSVNVSFSGLKTGQTYYLSVYARNLAEPYVRGISSPPFPIRIIV
jgi:hypothetical protein